MLLVRHRIKNLKLGSQKSATPSKDYLLDSSILNCSSITHFSYNLSHAFFSISFTYLISFYQFKVIFWCAIAHIFNSLQSCFIQTIGHLIPKILCLSKKIIFKLFLSISCLKLISDGKCFSLISSSK